MRTIRFEGWVEALTASGLPERQRRSWSITLRWYLGFCRRSRAEVNVQSARDFIAWAEQEKRPQAWMLEEWKQAIRWFFQQAPRSEPIPAASPAEMTAGEAPSGDSAESPGRPAWKRAFLTVVRRRHYSYRTEQSYLVWLERFARHANRSDLETLGAEDIKTYLDTLALNERLSASSQRQALNALVFLYREVFGKELGDFSDFRRAKARSHLPVWLTAAEMRRLLDHLSGTANLMARVMFGGGIRLMELLRQREHSTFNVQRSMLNVQRSTSNGQRTRLGGAEVSGETFDPMLNRNILRTRMLRDSNPGTSPD